MNLLGAKLYDPSSAATKATTALLAMTAFDTTNLRLTVTVPSHGFLFCRMRCQLEGATTFPQVLLGLLNGASVVARVTPLAALPGTALATTRVPLVAEFVIPGLTPGSITLDAAYGVEIVVAATNIKYGGPNDTTTDNAWGAFVFELWDPQPLPTAAPGAINGLLTAPTTANISTVDILRVDGTALTAHASGKVPTDVLTVAGTAQTGRDLGAQCDTTISSRMATYTQPAGFLGATFPIGTIATTTNITAGIITTVTNLTNAPTAGDLTSTMKSSVTTAVNSATTMPLKWSLIDRQ